MDDLLDPLRQALAGISRTDLIWWVALAIQLVAIPGTLFPVLPGLALLPIGAGLWCWAVGWSAGWPALALAVLILLLGWGADALGLVLGAARLKASRWAYIGAGLGLVVGLLGLLPALPVGGPLLGALVGPLAGAALGELVAELGAGRTRGFETLRRSLVVGLAVVSGMLVSRLAQVILALIGVLGFVVLSVWLPG
ncbi:DUF456 family protein [Vulcanococcus limneticus]|uniref:DUF456 family protein n=1 Tax=Vulcanococcus limneticus TaxID=2170428 RepID=UPI000B9909F5|nr:DUF456 family protein [Vulcanococcus limneticus]MCP9792193.1 DUF456 family protein [Vulcanococcus limneticus MW73D5]MCP9894435.1 DUF456 family protein [Vulcanococcus limneticus Candia 3F8]MCP9897616.1 DUF456 family protein [Vulcanococcus limneticus Candia 3B3]